MNRWTKLGCLLAAFCVTARGDESGQIDGWKTQRIHDRFYTEGASAGDIDGDGVVDLVAGPLWFRGPDFEQSVEIAPPREFPVASYSDQFFSSVFDANGDDANDVLVIGFPGKAARLYLNPGTGTGDWKMHEVADVVDNESPAMTDLVPGGLPEIVCGREGQYGFYKAGDDATSPWKWTPITRPGACAGRFAHGMGVGDIDGDGRPDVLDKRFWWRQPESGGGTWDRREWAAGNYGQGGAQICVADIDGDGDSDIVSSLNAHGFGLAWFEQTESKDFVRHDIMGVSSTQNAYGVSFSQLHAVELVDIDGDGLQDIVTGKRWMAHRGKDPGGLQEPVLYWFQCRRTSDGVEFLPRLIDHDSGVGVEVLVTDLNDDGRPDVVTSSKRGLAVHTQVGNVVAARPRTWKIVEGTDQSTYADGFAPEEAAKNMMVPAGFSVDLIASEPELTQPIAMCFDARGRIWVIEGHTYPTKAPEGQGRDRIIILEDTDADGTFETKKTFATGINLASGIEVGFGGVWVGAAPHLLYFPDADRDDVPDGEPEVLLDGFGYQDTHETLNSFTWGPDGWLYGCHGVFTHSNVGNPGANDSERTRINAGVWRYHPTRHDFEVFAHGTSNPWGVDFNDQGEWFLTACVIPHLYHIQKGARYQRQAGQHFNPHTYDDIKTIADHAHYVGSIRDHAFWGDNKQNKPSAPTDTSLLGGGHAHCGLAIYNGDAFPKSFYGELFFHNLHGHRVVSESVHRDGSGYIGKHRPDFARARDHKEIGVGVMVGPDGAIYTSDWHDIQTCHNRVTEVWDRTNGRMFRIRYGEVRPQRFDLWSESDSQLVALTSSSNGFFARQAQRILHERAAAGTLDTDAVNAELTAAFLSSKSQRDRLRAMWTRWCIGGLGEQELLWLTKHADEYVRGWAIHFIGEHVAAGKAFTGYRELASLAATDDSAVVQRYLASLLQDIAHEHRWAILSGMTRHAVLAHDRNLPFLVWYGMEPLVEQQPSRAYEAAKKAPWTNLLRHTVRRLTSTSGGRALLVDRLADPAERGQRLLVLEELSQAVASRGGEVTMPSKWPDAYAQLASAPLPRVRQLARSLGVQFGDQSVFPYLREILADRSKPKTERLDALAVLRAAKDSKLPGQVYPLLDDRDVSAAVAAALAQFDDAATPDRLLAAFKDFDEATRTAALGTLVARPASAEKLVGAMESKLVEPSSVPAFIVRQATSMGRKDLTERLEKVWGRIAESSEEKQAAYAKYRRILRPRAIAGANASRGRLLYEKNCGKCHKLFGVGGAIGPDITGANRTKVDYWLENILEPNALIGKAYQVTTFLTSDGRVLSGIVKSENDDAVTLQTATEQVVIAQDDIEEASLSNVSLMPEGQLQPMRDAEVLDLFKYLMSPTQVPIGNARLREPGTIVFEGESIKATHTGGTARPQGMGGFGPHWSGNSQLWWTGAKVGSVLTLEMTPESSGKYDLVVQLTRARDYARVEVSADGIETQPADLFDPTVSLADPLRWSNVAVEAGKPFKVRVKVVGKNKSAVPSLMVGVDHIELVPSK